MQSSIYTSKKEFAHITFLTPPPPPPNAHTQKKTILNGVNFFFTYSFFLYSSYQHSTPSPNYHLKFVPFIYTLFIIYMLRLENVIIPCEYVSIYGKL